MNHLDTTPYWPNIAELDYPPQVKKLLKAAEDAWSKWTLADTERAVKIEELNESSTNHAANLKSAARTGAPMPKPLDIRGLEDAVVYATERCVMERHELSLAVERLQKSFRDNRVELAHLAIEKAEAGMDEYRESIRAISSELQLIEEKRRAAYDGLVMLSDYSAPEVRFVPHYGVGGDTKLPLTHESEAKASVASIRTMLAIIEANSNGETEQPVTE